ncbi:MAG: endonuclease [Ferruginibacter sp.]|nr:endonuclease [Ferruginibacter sp.]
MPEGPSLILIKEKIDFFTGKKIVGANGYAKIDFAKIINKKIIDIKTWGKHLFICLKDTNIEIHLRLFGSVTINERKPKINPKLQLRFLKDELNFYLVDAKLTPHLSVFDWAADVMSDEWNAGNAIKKLKEIPDAFICDALLDQQIFSGVGNIIKNEVLWKVKLHPENRIGNITAPKLKMLMKEVVIYSFEFLKYRKEETLSKHWNAYSQKICSRCNNAITKKNTGKGKRTSYYCGYCQKISVS